MPVLIALAALFALVKDTAYLGVASDIARLASVALAGIAGAILAAGVVLSRTAVPLLPVLGYLCCLLVPVTYAADSQYVLYHVVSLMCVTIASVAAFRGSDQRRVDALRQASLLLSLGIVAIIAISLAGLWLWPDRVWEYPLGDARRFRGLMPKAGGMGLIAVLCIGFSWFRFRSFAIRAALIVPCLAALVLSGSRTPAIAALIATFAVAIRYRALTKKVLLGSACFAVAAVAALWSGALRVDQSRVDAVARADSLATLSGRLAVWQRGVEAGESLPLFGHGLTMGSIAFVQTGGIHDAGTSVLGQASGLDSREAARVTLHNGYLQSYLDSGPIGIVLYLTVILLAIYRVYFFDQGRRYGLVLYVLVLLAVSNLAENVIQNVSTIYGMAFWIFAIAALTTQNKSAASSVSKKRISIRTGPRVQARVPTPLGRRAGAAQE
jgi:O-antigen ligase